VERKVLFDISDVSGGNKGCLTESAFALAALALQQVAFSLFATQDLPGASDFEALGDGLPCFCFSSYSWHGGRNLVSHALLARQKWKKSQVIEKRTEYAAGDVDDASFNEGASIVDGYDFGFELPGVFLHML